MNHIFRLMSPKRKKMNLKLHIFNQCYNLTKVPNIKKYQSCHSIRYTSKKKFNANKPISSKEWFYLRAILDTEML